MQVFRFLVLLLVISINVGHGYPRAWKKHDLSAEELGDNVTGEQLADNFTGEQLSDNVTGEQLSDNVTGEQLSDNVTGEQLNENATGEQLSENVTGEQLNENVTGEQLSENVTGEQLNENVTGEQLSENVTGEQLNENVTGEQLSENDEQLNENATDEQFDENATLKVVKKKLKDDKAMHVVTNKEDKVSVPGCKRNSYYWNKCNICHCTMAGSVECTAKTCDEPDGPTKLNKKLKPAQYEKLRDLATGCLPGQKVSSENCECECSIHSVLLCQCK